MADGGAGRLARAADLRGPRRRRARRLRRPAGGRGVRPGAGGGAAARPAAGDRDPERRRRREPRAVAAGELRPVYVPARPPSELEPAGRSRPRGLAARRGPAGDRRRRQRDVEGTVPFVPDAPEPTCWSPSARPPTEPVAVAVPADADGVAIEAEFRYDATRSMGTSPQRRRGRVLAVGEEALADAWYLAQALIAAESLGAVQTCLEMSVAYAKERFTFGRAIGSYQSIKHELTEVLRLQENTRGKARTPAVKTNRHRIAKAISNVTAPPFLAVPTYILLGLQDQSRNRVNSNDLFLGLAVCIFFGVIFPIAFIVFLFTRSKVTDMHISLREQRTLPYLVTILAYLVGFALLLSIQGPSILPAVMLCYAINAVVVMFVNFSWKISAHATGLGGPIAALTLVFGWAIAPLYLLIPLVDWARVFLKAHTLGQVIAGSLLGFGLTLFQLALIFHPLGWI